MLVAGVGTDVLVNTLLLLCGVIPGHIHGMYVTWTYFSRKRKVRRGRWPGGSKPLIYSRRVVNGDASEETVRRLLKAEQARQAGKDGGWSGSSRGSWNGAGGRASVRSARDSRALGSTRSAGTAAHRRSELGSRRGKRESRRRSELAGDYGW